MSRITRKQLETLTGRLNEALGRPSACYVDGRAQIGCLHLVGTLTGLNVYEIANTSGGCRAHAYSLSNREAFEWLSGALAALRLAADRPA